MANEALNWQNTTHTINWFTTINDIWNLSSSFLETLNWSFNKNWPYKEVLNNWISFSWKQFYLYWDDVFMFEYSSMEELKQDMESWKKRFKKKNIITSETIDWKQILESSWYFEFNWKFYLLWLLYQDLNNEDNDENNWVYKWVIVNPWKYFEVENEVKEISWKVGGIL